MTMGWSGFLVAEKKLKSAAAKQHQATKANPWKMNVKNRALNEAVIVRHYTFWLPSKIAQCSMTSHTQQFTCAESCIAPSWFKA